MSTRSPIVGRKLRWRSLSPAVLGFLSLIWFLIRVIPKPSRAAYPCQRAAAPLASAFVIWLAGLFGSVVVFRSAWRALARASRPFGVACLLLVPVIGLSGIFLHPWARVSAWTPAEGPNNPMGTARGIHPGRVVWVRGAKAVKWDGSTGNWHDDTRGDQKTIARMMSRGVRSLAGANTDEAAWAALFKYNNGSRGRGNVGYGKGETIAIKPNLVSCFQYDHGGATAATVDNDAHLIYALVDQLVHKAGVPAGKIMIYTAPSLLSTALGDQVVPDYIYKKIRSNPEFKRVRFYDTVGANGRMRASVSTRRITWSVPGADAFEPDYIADVPANATYLINFAVLKSHANNGVSLCGKNHGGSFCRSLGAVNSPGHNFLDLHQYMNTGSVGGDTFGNYRPFVDLMGHRDFGGKTVLYLIDGLWGGNLPSGWNGVPERWNSCGISNDWPKSLFASQDPVAIDSVALDFCYAQYSITQGFLAADDYLHEAAQANAPPSGSYYAPNGDGVRLGSLGTHEHWNNSIDRKYSRNLSPAGTGIELVSARPR